MKRKHTLTSTTSVDVLSFNGTDRGVITFQSVLLTRRTRSFEKGLCVCMITFEMSLHLTCEMCWSTTIDNENKESNFFNMSLKTNITSEFSLQRTNPFFYIGFSKPCLSIPLRMRLCDSCPQHETWQLAMTFEFTFVASEWLASFQSGFTYPTRREKSLETSPQCLWITGCKIDPK